MDDDIKTIGNLLSKNYANVKESVNNEIVSSFNKLPSLNIKSNIVEKKKDTQFLDVSWKTYRIASIGILLISIFIANFVRIEFELRTSDSYIIMLVNIILVFFIFNLGIFLFYKTYYKYITTLKGKKGLKGIRGKRGLNGKDSMCDISKKKISTFERKKDLNKKEKIVEKDTSIDIKNLYNSTKGWYEAGNDVNSKIGFNCDRSERNNNKSKIKISTPVIISKDGNNKNAKPIIGALVNFDKDLNKITAIQYLYDKNKSHNKKKYSIGNYGETKNDINFGTIGDINKKSKNMEKYNFVCPSNSAIYKIDSVYDSNGIKGLKFYCQNIDSGNSVKSYNSKNKKVYGVSFGIEPKQDDPNYLFDKVECGTKKKNGKIYPSFISKISGDYSDKNQSIKNLTFHNCSIYKDY